MKGMLGLFLCVFWVHGKAFSAEVTDLDQEFQRALQCMEEIEKPGNVRVVRDFVSTVTKDPLRFYGRATTAGLDRLRLQFDAKNPAVKSMALVLFLIGNSTPAMADAESLARTLPDPRKEESGLLAAVGFWPALKATPDELNRLLSLADGRSPPVRAGIWSLYLRSGGDRKRLDEIMSKPQMTTIPDIAYWQTLNGKPPAFPAPANQWAFLRKYDGNKAICDSIRQNLDAPEVAPMLDEMLKDPPEKQGYFNRLLWDLRKTSCVQQLKGLKEYVYGQYKKSHSEPLGTRPAKKILWAGLIAEIYKEQAPLKETLDELEGLAPENKSTWPAELPLLLELTPQPPALDVYRKNVAQRKELHSKWLLWMLDLAMGKNPGKVPVDSLAYAVQGDHLRFWMPIFINLGVQLKPYTSELRHIAFFFRGTSNGPDEIMEYLGVLDRAEVGM